MLKLPCELVVRSLADQRSHITPSMLEHGREFVAELFRLYPETLEAQSFEGFDLGSDRPLSDLKIAYSFPS